MMLTWLLAWSLCLASISQVVVADRVVLQSLLTPQVPIEGEYSITAYLKDSPPAGVPITCNIAWRTDSWSLAIPAWNGSSNANTVVCPSMPSLPAEGPVDFFVKIGDDVSNKLTMWTFASFSASMGMTPYYAQTNGTLLLRINDTYALSPNGIAANTYKVSAVTADGAHKLLDSVHVLGGDLKRAVSMNFHGLGDTVDTLVNLTLHGAYRDSLKLQVRLVRVAARRTGAVAVDHTTRGILIDGEPFFPISWMTTMDSFGTAVMASTMAQMALRGANSIMIYNLGDVGADPEPKELDVYEVVRMMDTAQAVGLKVQMHIIKMVAPIAKDGGTKDQWSLLEKFIQTWRDHPALLGWYVADDGSWPHLPQVYDRIKELDPYHLITMAIAGIGVAWKPTYLHGSDVVMAENYHQDPSTSWLTMHIMSYFPYDWQPRVTCSMAWPSPVTSTAMFRTELYNSIVAGATGDIWFAHRSLPGEWAEPGPLFDASGVLAKEMLELVPSLLPTEVVQESENAAAQPVLEKISGTTQEGAPGLVHATARREASGCVHLLLVNNLNEPVRASVRFAHGTSGIYTDSIQLVNGVVPFEKSLPGAARLVRVVKGSLSEWLPSWGTQVFRFNGTGNCASLPTVSLNEPSNFVLNPSFEHSLSYVASPDRWSCDATAAQDRSCFADSSVAKEGRRSGRFASGANFGSFRIRVPIKGVESGQRYTFSAWLRGDCTGQAVSLKSTPVRSLSVIGSGADVWWGEAAWEEDITSVVVGTNWTRLEASVVMPMRLSFALRKPGVVWVDAVRLSLPSQDSEEVPVLIL